MNLSPRQQGILRFIREFSRQNGYPPTIREIGKEVGISSTSVVNYNLNKLEKNGLLDRSRTISRGLRVVETHAPTARLGENMLRIPIAGTIVASKPMPPPDDAFAHIPRETIELTRDIVREREGLFALRVKGNSMVDALVNDGDIVVMKKDEEVHNGDMVAVWLKDRGETTLKRIYREKNRVRLQPANPTMNAIYVNANNVEVQGKVMVVIRQLS
ncbi:MAG: transcriptional repressor LexA [Chloroflexi bacterium]|nr:transcriptional repressor LexA [Chloroflexota bacterium]